MSSMSNVAAATAAAQSSAALSREQLAELIARLQREAQAESSASAAATSSGSNGLYDQRIPVTVLTGFLGSGKTTLLNWILSSNEHKLRIAIIENEYGEVGIDQALIKRADDSVQADEELVEMNNGCICCTVRGDLINILNKLHNKSKRAGKAGRIQHVLIETTGLADPGPVAQTFFVDDSIQARYRLEGIVTVVDAFHIATALKNSKEAQEQIAFADIILLNKTDLVPDAQHLDQLEAQLHSINAAAVVHRTTNSRVDPGKLLAIGGFNVSRALHVDPTFFQPEQPFEYAAAYDLQQAGRYRLHLPEGPDASMKVVLLPALAPHSSSSVPMDVSGPQGQHAATAVTVSSLVTADVPRVLHEQSNAAMALFTSNRALKTKSHIFRPGSSLPPLSCDEGVYVQLSLAESTSNEFVLDVQSPGTWILFTEHQPSEYGSAEGWQIFPVSDAQSESSQQPLIPPVAVHSFKPTHEHGLSVSSVGIEIAQPLNERKLNAWLGKLLREQGNDLYRSKGVLWLDGWKHRYVFHAVHMLWSGREDTLWKPNEKKINQMIFIGRNLNRQALTNGFMDCVQRV